MSEKSLVLRSGYALVADDDGAAAPDTIQLRAPDGRICLKITLGPQGPEVELSGASLSLATVGAVRVDCERFEVNARDGVGIVTGGALATEAFEQRHRATHGDVALVANDDVSLDGERILLNKPKVLPPMVATRREESHDGE